MENIDQSDEHIIRIRLTALTLQSLRNLLDEMRPDLGCRPSVQRTSEGYVTDAYLPKSKLAAADSARAASDVQLKVIEDITASGLARQSEVGQGDRFAARGVIPKGLGKKE